MRCFLSFVIIFANLISIFSVLSKILLAKNIILSVCISIKLNEVEL